jgi:hypothetical protein
MGGCRNVGRMNRMLLLFCVAFMVGIPTVVLEFKGGAADPPSVTATQPVAGAIGVPLKPTLTATFSESMDPVTITTETFTVMGPDKISIQGTISWN